MLRTRLAAVLALALTAALPAGAQTAIDFDGTSAPCAFVQTSPLTTAYAAQGVTFGGGLAILNACGGFGFAARSGTDFLAFNTGTYAAGPAVLTFAAPVGRVSIFAATSASGAAFTLESFDASGTLLGTAALVGGSTWRELAVEANGIASVRLSSTASAGAYDDLAFGPTSTVPEPSTYALLGSGLLAVGGVTARRRRAAR